MQKNRMDRMAQPEKRGPGRPRKTDFEPIEFVKIKETHKVERCASCGVARVDLYRTPKTRNGRPVRECRFCGACYLMAEDGKTWRRLR